MTRSHSRYAVVLTNFCGYDRVTKEIGSARRVIVASIQAIFLVKLFKGSSHRENSPSLLPSQKFDTAKDATTCAVKNLKVV